MKPLLLLLAACLPCSAAIGEGYEALSKRFGLPKEVTVEADHLILVFSAKDIKICVFLSNDTSTREIYEAQGRVLSDEEKIRFRDSSSGGLRWNFVASNQVGIRPYAEDGDKPYWMRSDGHIIAISRSDIAFEVVVVAPPVHR
jgi:hypothetical protein